MDNLKTTLLSEIDKFNEAGHKFLAGEISRTEFKGVSGGMGVYAHRDGKEFMIRLRIPSGVAVYKEMKFVYDLAKRYNLGGIHLTTRQAIQLHGLGIDEICEIIREGIHRDIYTRGAGGNYPRNVALSPLSGVDPEEAFDVTPYALAVNNHFLKKINTYKLPRKFKVSFSSSNSDAGHVTISDQGFLAVKENGREYFKVYIGGGLGRNPKLAVELENIIEPKDILYHVEAITNLFISEGDYTNKAKARIRYILDRMGKDEFIKCYEKHLNEVMKKEKLDLVVESKVYNKEGIETTVRHKRLFVQKQKGLYSVYFHPLGGQLTLDTLKLILDEIESIADAEVRLDMSEGLYIRNLNGEEAEKLLKVTEGLGGEFIIEQSTACIGVPTCQIGIAESQKLLMDIIEFFRQKKFTKDILPKVHISGCPNSCGVHEIGQIGFCGKMKKVKGVSKPVFELHLHGYMGVDKTKLGKHFGDMPQENIPVFLYELAKNIEESKLDFATWIDDNIEQLEILIEKYSV